MSCQIAKTEYWKIMIWLSDTKCCHLAIHYVLPKFLPGPNLHIRFMKNCIHTSLLGSLAVHLQLAKCVTQLKRRCKSHFCICLLHFINTRAAPLWENKQINKFPIDANFISLWELMQWGWDFRKQSMYVAFKVLFCTCNFIFCNTKSCFGRYMTLKVFLKTCKVHVQ